MIKQIYIFLDIANSIQCEKEKKNFHAAEIFFSCLASTASVHNL